MSNSFSIEYDFVEKWAKNSRPEHFQVYIYLLCQLNKHRQIPTVTETAKSLNMKEATVQGSYDFWCAVGVLNNESNGFSVSVQTAPIKENSALMQVRPTYKAGEITEAMKNNDELGYLFSQAQILLGKTLSSSDVEILYSFYDWLTLPVEVIVMLLGYSVSIGKKSFRYIEKIAVDWADNGITTFELAERHMRKLEAYNSKTGKIKNVLGIFDRQPTETEKKYLSSWTELDMPIELFSVAYDRTVTATGKLSMAYMDKILKNWDEKHIVSIEQLKDFEDKYKQQNAEKQKPYNKTYYNNNSPQKSKFNNFSNDRPTDFDALERKALNNVINFKKEVK